MSDGYTTQSRSRILEFLKSQSTRTVDVSDIRRALATDGNEVNITTIYRYLDKLTSDGTVMKYVAENGTRAVYQYVGERRHCEDHLHLQCTKCGCIIHLDCRFMDEIAEHVLREHGFSIQCRNSIIYGLCEKCAADTI
ncbi:MAG: transcriptional repressor [Spirochaetales bacterium]|nr:transcriptional repressor [Spirochaetales bacterium]